jgi:hypothetical protein
MTEDVGSWFDKENDTNSWKLLGIVVPKPKESNDSTHKAILPASSKEKFFFRLVCDIAKEIEVNLPSTVCLPRQRAKTLEPKKVNGVKEEKWKNLVKPLMENIIQSNPATSRAESMSPLRLDWSKGEGQGKPTVVIACSSK